MRNRKSVLALVMVIAMIGSLLAACGSNNNKESGSNSSTKPEKVTFATLSFNRIPNDLSRITEAVNKITREKINVEVDLKIFGPADYAQRVNLALQSGEKLDLFTAWEQFPNFASKNQLYPLNDLIDKYGQEMKAILDKDFGEDLLTATTIDGKIYGIPANRGMSIPVNFVYNADMLAEIGFTADDIQSVEDLPAIFDALQEKYPEVVPFGPINVNPSDTALMQLLKGVNKIDYLTDSSGVGVVLGDSGEVVNLYETEAFKEGVAMMREWYENGYLQKDAVVATNPFSEMVSSGRGFSFMGGYGGMAAGEALSAQTGKNVDMKRIAPFYFDTNAVIAVTWMMSSTTDVPEASMKFLNLLFSDEELLNTLLYGIEGEDYIKVDEHHVKFPEGKDASTVEYTAHLSSGLLGSESLQYQLEGMDWSDIELKLRENKETERSPYFGFIFNQNEVKTEVSSVNNVVNQYLPGLVTGSLDPDKAIPQFVDALNDAGAKTIIKAKQEQLDAWLANQNK
ncbi:ABC transporter substrate-binding protein [Marinicrinis lubricantis]|uniref:ABC transporter substrate-binding protein n=1 Tax=Marinicrinis lubricantis TaxID=2086470 RepID=A0ABW1IKL0_9BACL